MKNRTLETNRLRLVEVGMGVMAPLLDDSTRTLSSMGLTAHPQWPTDDTRDILNFIAGSTGAETQTTGFNTLWLIVKVDDHTVIGDVGYKGNPDPQGNVEIGYGIVEHEREKGYGFEAAAAMVEWGLSHPKVQCIKATCALDNPGSIRILQKMGMRATGQNEELIFWEKHKS